MRVTTQTVSAQVIDRLQRAFQRVARAQEIVTTGKRINRLSDNPIDATRALGLRGFEESLGQYKRNIDTTLPFLERADSTLGNIVESLTRAKELALSVANDTNSSVERHSVAQEIHQIFLHVLAGANTRVENRFLFGGFLNGTAPFAAGPNGVDYLGDGGEIFIQTGPASTLGINLPGHGVFQGAGVAGGTGIFDVLRDLETVLKGASAANSLSLGVNLDDQLAAGAGFSPPDAVGTEAPATTFLGEADFSTVVTVFDSLGQPHDLTFLFAKTGATTFRYRVVASSDEIVGGTAGNLYQVAPEGVLEFSPGGTLNAGASTLTDITLVSLANGAADFTIAATDLSFAGSTHLSRASAVLSLAQTNTNGIQPQLGRLDAALNQIITFRADVGARLNSAKVSADAVAVLKDTAVGQRSLIEDADVLAAYSDFTRFEYAFEAALQSASRIIQPSLLDFVR